MLKFSNILLLFAAEGPTDSNTSYFVLVIQISIHFANLVD